MDLGDMHSHFLFVGWSIGIGHCYRHEEAACVCRLYFQTSNGCIDVAWHPLSTSGLKLTVRPSPVTSIASRNNPFNGFLNRSWVIVVGDGFLISLYALRISRLWDGQWAILSAILHELKFKVWEFTLMEEASAATTHLFCQNANLLRHLLYSLLWLLLYCFLLQESRHFLYFLGVWNSQMSTSVLVS